MVIAIVASQRLGSGDVQGELGGYQLVDDETLSVTIKVTRADPSRPVVCIVRARSRSTAAKPGAGRCWCRRRRRTPCNVTTTVKSTRPPVVGDVYGCGTDVPAYLVAP